MAWSDGAHDAFDRMRRAHKRGTGCHLTADMVESLSLTIIGQMWFEDDPREDGDDDLNSGRGIGDGDLSVGD